MKPDDRSRATRALGPLLLMGLSACGGLAGVEASDAPSGYLEDAAAAPVVILGTALEASSRRPLEGVVIEGPGGTQARSDAEGHFRLTGLRAGMSGVLVARTPDGLSGRNPLRPLAAGELEVVIFLR